MTIENEDIAIAILNKAENILHALIHNEFDNARYEIRCLKEAKKKNED